MDANAEEPADSPGGEPLRVVVLSEIVANEEIPVASADPRAAAILAEPLVSEEHNAIDGDHPRAILVHGTRSSKLRLAAAMAHDVTGPKKMALHVESFADLGRLIVAAEVPQGEELRLVKYLGYGWSSAAVPARAHRPGVGRPGRRRADRLGRAARGAARVPRRLLGGRGRRGRRRRGDPAGRPVRAVPHPAGRRARRAAADPGQGPDRDRVRRPHLLGHRDVRAPGADLHAPVRRGGRAALAGHHPRHRARARGRARPRRRGVRVADDPRRGVLRLLARGHGRLPHQRRHRRRRRELPRRDARTRSSSARSACRSSSRPPACGARSASTTPTASSASRASPARTSTARSRTTTSTRT